MKNAHGRARMRARARARADDTYRSLVRSFRARTHVDSSRGYIRGYILINARIRLYLYARDCLQISVCTPRPREARIEGSREKGCRSLADGLSREMKRAREQEREREMIEGMDGTVGKAERKGRKQKRRERQYYA